MIIEDRPPSHKGFPQLLTLGQIKPARRCASMAMSATPRRRKQPMQTQGRWRMTLARDISSMQRPPALQPRVPALRLKNAPFKSTLRAKRSNPIPLRRCGVGARKLGCFAALAKSTNMGSLGRLYAVFAKVKHLVAGQNWRAFNLWLGLSLGV